MGQPAMGFARRTFFSGDSIFTVSAMNRTPHMMTVSASVFAASTLRP